MRKVVVIGGGISGLACAEELLDLVPGVDVRVVEASPRVGGVIATHSRDGFVCEAGAHGFMNRDASTLALARRLGLDRELVVADERWRGRFVLVDRRLRRFPLDLTSFLKSDLLSVRGRLRLLAEPLLPMRPLSEDVPVGPFMRERLGPEATAMLVDPLLTGIFGGDLERLSLAAALPQVSTAAALGQGVLTTLLRQVLRRPALVGGLPSGRLISFTRGTGRLIEALAQRLGARVHTDRPVARVRPHGRGWQVQTMGDTPTLLEADVVVSAAPAAATARYLGDLDSTLSLTLARLRAAPAVVVSLGYRVQDLPGLLGFGYLSPSCGRSPVLGVLNSSAIFPLRAPDGMVLVEAILGGSRDEAVCDRHDEEIIALVTAELAAAAGADRPPVFTRLTRHDRALPQYDVGHLERVEALSRRLARFPGLFLTGHALRGVGISACTREAARTAAAVAAYLAAPAPVVRTRRASSPTRAQVGP